MMNINEFEKNIKNNTEELNGVKLATIKKWANRKTINENEIANLKEIRDFVNIVLARVENEEYTIKENNGCGKFNFEW